MTKYLVFRSERDVQPFISSDESEATKKLASYWTDTCYIEVVEVTSVQKLIRPPTPEPFLQKVRDGR